jgi:hypothetical protein
MNARIILVLALFAPCVCRAQTPGQEGNAFLSNQKIGLMVRVASVSHATFPGDALMGIVVPAGRSTEFHLIGSYHNNDDAWSDGPIFQPTLSPHVYIYRGFGIRALSLRAGITEYFHADAKSTPFVGAALGATFYHRYSFSWKTPVVLTLGNSTLTAQIHAGIAWTPASFFQLRGAYVFEYSRDIMNRFAVHYLRQRLELGVVLKIPG